MIKEIIVVEGRSDTLAIKRAVEADTIETGGSRISKETIKLIELAQKQRGVIILTDPDYQGERIRKIISAKVKGVKHAFLPREVAKKGGKYGVEFAEPKEILKALANHYTEGEVLQETIPWELLIINGLIGGTEARLKREALGNLLGIGYTNAKQLYKRLNALQIDIKAFNKAVNQLK